MNMQRKIHFHGELCIVEVEETKVVGKQLVSSEDVKLADSEVTGNDHMLEMVKGVTVFSDADADRFFVKSEVPATIYCKIRDRHTDLVLPAGTYEIGKAQEWDHIEQSRRNVLD
jgi:hypothetical protein